MIHTKNTRNENPMKGDKTPISNGYLLLISWLGGSTSTTTTGDRIKELTGFSHRRQVLTILITHYQLQESDKGQIFYWSIQTCSRIRLLFDCDYAQKTSKLPYFRLFQPVTQILSALTALTWPSYRLLLTQYHQIPTSTALYWPSTIMYHPLLLHYHQVLTSIAPFWPSTIVYQPVPPSTDPAPSYIN